MQEQKQLSHFAQTKEEAEIIQSIEKSQLIENLRDLEPLLNVVSYWRMYIGLPKGDATEELVLVSEFIYKNYGYLTIEEIRLACNLSVTRQLEDVEFYGSFSPLYVGKILDAYKYHRKRTLAETIRRKEVHDNKQKDIANKPTPEESQKMMKELFRDFYKEYQETGEVRDVFNFCYNFLREHKWISPTPAEVDAAMAWGKEKAAKAKEDFKNKSPFDKFRINEEVEYKRWARNWCVQNYFKSVNIDVLLNNIKAELFT